MKTILLVALLTAGVTTFSVCLYVHGSTYFNVDWLERHHSLWFLHLLVFGLALPVIWLEPSVNGVKRVGGNALLNDKRAKGLAFGFKAFFGYALLNFVLCMVLLGGATPGRRDPETGAAMVREWRRPFEPASEERYARLCLLQTRAFSGHWMLFAYLPIAQVLYLWRRDAWTWESR